MEYIYLLTMVLLTTAGQLFTKKGSKFIVWQGPKFNSLKGLFNKYIMLAAMVTMVGPVFYVLALRRLDLSVAFGF